MENIRPSLAQVLNKNEDYVINLFYDVWEKPGSTKRRQEWVKDIPATEAAKKYGNFIFDNWYTTGKLTADVWAIATDDRAYDDPHPGMSKEEATIASIKADLESGNLHAKWDGWCFSGGRDWGDWTVYQLFKDKERFGSVEINDRNGVTVRDEDGAALVLDFENDEVVEDLEATLIGVLTRDDPAFISKVTVDGEIRMPGGYGDIDRDDVISGRWSPEAEEERED